MRLKSRRAVVNARLITVIVRRRKCNCPKLSDMKYCTSLIDFATRWTLRHCLSQWLSRLRAECALRSQACCGIDVRLNYQYASIVISQASVLQMDRQREMHSHVLVLSGHLGLSNVCSVSIIT